MRLCNDQARVVKRGLERRIKGNAPDVHPIVGWAVEHAADCLNRYKKGEDQMTAVRRLNRGRPEATHRGIACNSVLRDDRPRAKAEKGTRHNGSQME